MRSRLLRSYVAAAVLVTLAGGMTVAQKITTTEELDKAMKKAQPAMGAANKALKANDLSEARNQLGVVKQVMLDTREFWVHHKKDDALKFNAETVAKIEETEKLLAGNPPTTEAAAALKELGGACRSCHEIYRARDADNNWVLKPGSVD